MNNKIRVFLATSLVLLTNGLLKGQSQYPPQMENAKVEIYKIINDIELKLWIFDPPGHGRDAKSPAIVFFFGGGWRQGSPGQFQRHCEYLASRGMVAMAADYRVSGRHGVNPSQCVSDAKSAIRWIKEHSTDLGIDPGRLVAAGGSAGGHLAAATATLPDFEEPDEDLTISSRPSALVLFNPAVVLDNIKGQYTPPPGNLSNLLSGFEAELSTISPYHHIDDDVGPTIIFHGTTDTTVPFQTVQLFAQRMQALGNSCTLVGYEGSNHAFFNYGRESNAPYIDTVHRMDEFLVSIGYLLSPPIVVVD